MLGTITFTRAMGVAALVVALAACGDDDSTPAADTGSTGTGAVTTTVEIRDFAFAPADLTVGVGSTVTWKNEDGATHTVTGDDDGFDSADLPGGAEFSQTFDEAGTFTYHCEIHPSMTGTVRVEN
jgi:plastocyanin